jgi:hypothetical protein
MMEDPLFGIAYDPHVVKFQPIPPSLLTRCPGLRAQYVRGWIYGHLKSAGSEYYLVSGLMPYHGVNKRQPEIAPDESGGLALALRGKKCLVDQADYFLTQKINPAAGATPIAAPRSVVNRILQNVFERYTAAFGGKEQFLKQVTPEAIGPHVVLEQLGKFEGSPHNKHGDGMPQ